MTPWKKKREGVSGLKKGKKERKKEKLINEKGKKEE